MKMPIHALFGVFGGIIPPNDVTYSCNPKKDRPWAESRHLSHKTWISAARFELGVGLRKRTVGYRTGKESQMEYISSIWGEAPVSRSTLCSKKSGPPNL